MNERSGGRKRSEQFRVSERVSGASERANGRASGLVIQSVFLAVFDHSDQRVCPSHLHTHTHTRTHTHTHTHTHKPMTFDMSAKICQQSDLPPMIWARGNHGLLISIWVADKRQLHSEPSRKYWATNSSVRLFTTNSFA